MILSLFWAIFIISGGLIALGVIYSKEWAGTAFIGFTFLFLLSYVILTGNLQYETGNTVQSTYSYDGSGMINGTVQEVEYQYESWSDSNSHIVGYSMAILSAIGAFSSLLITLTKWGTKK